MGSAFAENDITIAFPEGTEPWILTVNDSISGVYPAIMKELAKRTGRTAKFQALPLARAEAMLKIGSIDLIIGLKDTEERKAFLHFLDTPYRYSSSKIFYVRKGEGNRLRSYEDLYVLKVGTQRGTKYFAKFDEDLNLHKEEVHLEDQNFQKLVFSHVDVLIIPEDRGEFILTKLGLRDKVERAPFFFQDETPRFIAISKFSSAIKDVPAYEVAMKTIRDDGTLGRLYQENYISLYKVSPNSVRWK